MGPTFIVGAGGLVGSAVARVDQQRRGTRPHAVGVSWDDERRAASTLREAAAVINNSQSPRVLWLAGAGVNGMSSEDAAREVRVFSAFLDVLQAPDVVFLASSAGALYSGSSGPPFDELTLPVPSSHYGTAKLGMETALTTWAEARAATALIGRLANIYGPGQNLAKPQGLISHLCLASVRRRPVSIYVPLDTRRDYIYVDDAARRVLDSLDRAPRHVVTTKIICSRESVTVAGVVATVRAVSPRPVPILLGDSPLRTAQTADLRLRSRILPEIDLRPTTPFAAGVAITMRAIDHDFARPRSDRTRADTTTSTPSG